MDADVVVLGGGLVGSALTAFLARAGVDVVRVDPDRGGHVGGEGVGLVDLGVMEQPHRTVASLGAERAAELFAFARRGRDLLAHEGLLTGHGGRWVALTPREAEELPRSMDAVRAAGHRASVGGPDDDGLGLGPALVLPGDAQVDAGACLARFREAGRAVVGEGRCRWSADDRLEVWVGGERIRAEAVVLAAGAASSGLDPALEGALLPVREQHLRARVDVPVGSGRAGQGWTAWRTEASGTVVVSGCRWASPHLEVGEGLPAVVPAIQERLEAFLGRLGSVEVVHRWSAAFSQTRDGLPLVGPLPGDPRRLVCAGFGASPWALGVAAAEAVASALVGGPARVPDGLSSRRLVRWRRGASV